MKTNNLYRPAAILTGVAALFMTWCVASSAAAQDTKQQKVTATVTASPSKDKKEQKVTVVAKSDSRGKDGKVNVHIIKDENGKKTEIDTVISAKGGMNNEELEALMEKVHIQMKDVEDRMKDVELYMNAMNDSLLTDSSGHHKYMFKFKGGQACPNIHIKEFPHAFNYDFEMPEMPESIIVPDEFNHEFFNQRERGPQVISIPKTGESLSDVLGDIPMSRVKSYKIIDKKGGKRIIIDLEDGPFPGHGDQVIYINGSGHPQHQARGAKHQEGMKVIINTDTDKGETNKPEPPAPPSEPNKL